MTTTSDERWQWAETGKMINHPNRLKSRLEIWREFWRETHHSQSEKAADSRARRAAKRAGLVARKSRWRSDTVDNMGGFMLIEPRTKTVVDGSRFNLSADDVIERCTPRPE